MNTINTVEDLIRALDENPEWIEALRKRLLTQELLELPEKIAQFVEAANNRFDRVEANVGALKGWYVSELIRDDPSDIAEEMGFTYGKNLRRSDLTRLTRFSDTSGIPLNELRSFRMADLVMEANDKTGDFCYIALEISYTVDRRDTGRAIRNAAFLTRFTGHKAYAAVTSVYRDYRTEDQVESGEVFWYQLPREIMIIE